MAANEVRRTIVDYGTDPAESWLRRLIGDTRARVQGLLVPAVVGADDDPSTTFYGYGPGLQDFRGAASPASTGVTFRDGGSPTLSDGVVEGPLGDPARRMFADRLRRRRPLL